MTQLNFESFLSTNGQDDILTKAFALHSYLDKDGNSSEQALGIQILSGAQAKVKIKNRQGKQQDVIMLGSNSYLNLTLHPQVLEASRKALDKYGYGMGAVSLYAGITDLHRELEERIARFTGTQDAILFPSGYGTNIGVIASLCGKGDVIINDSANHASIFDGSLLSGAELKIYPHNNIKRLEQVLAKLPPKQKGRLIITDGVFSMHGDIARLDEIVALAKKYGARVMVDDAHGIGVVGPSGRGTAEIFGLQDKVDMHVSMLSKAPGGLGGYCAGTKELITYLRLYARTYFFSTAMPAPVIAGLIEVFKLLESDTAGRAQLWENIRYMHRHIRDLGFTTNEPTSGIVPIIIGDEQKLGSFHKALLDAGVYTNIVTYPAVRRKECRLRLCIMASLSREDMDSALCRLEDTGKRCGIL